MKAQPVQKKAAMPQADAEKTATGKTMPPPQFALQNGSDSGAGVAQKQDAGVAQKQDAGGQSMTLAAAQTTPVIETTGQAWSHYMNGGGRSVDIGPNTIQLLLNHPEFQRRHGRITGGLTTAMSGSFSVDMTGTMFHLGRTNINYSIQVSGNQCTVTYTLFVHDGFWDVDFIDENTLGRLGLPWFQPDGKGPNLERFGGTPYDYNTATRSFTFANPGYN